VIDRRELDQRRRMTDGLEQLASEATLYGFALDFNMKEVHRFTELGIGEVPATPFNQFGHAGSLAGPESDFVSINNDTLYSIAQLDLSAGPIRLEVPDTGGRYYVLQFIDAWTNNFAYVGHRGTGTARGSYMLLPPGDTTEPGDAVAIHVPTTIATIVGRFAVDGADDVPAVARLQAATTLTPSGSTTPKGSPAVTPGVAQDLAFFERLRTYLRAFPPAPRDVEFQSRFAPIGLLDGESPYVDPDPVLATALRVGLERGNEQLEAALRDSPMPSQNGWTLTYHAFDYNLDFFEVGTIDDPAWKLDTDPLTRFMVRAGSARGGLWGNHGYEAAYPAVYVDADGEQLTGSRCYQLRFEQPPPVDAFWSLTMYDTPNYYLVDNPIDRYSIGDRTTGVVTGDDGSITIYLQHDQPSDPAEAANWLPTPAGDFRPLMRMYEPREAVFDGTFELPPITRR
jgi:hypothetical protein